MACVLEPVPACTRVPRFAYRSVTGFGDRPVAIDLAGRVFARRKTEMRPEIAGMGKACRIIDAGGIGQRDNGAHTRYREKAPAHHVRPHGLEHHPMQHVTLLPQRGAGGQ